IREVASAPPPPGSKLGNCNRWPGSIGFENGARSNIDVDPSFTFARIDDSTDGPEMVLATGDTVTRRWALPDGSVLGSDSNLVGTIGCDAKVCHKQAYPGPDGTVVYAPHIDNGLYPMAVMVFGSSPIAPAAWLDSSIERVLGVIGHDLIAVSTVDGRSSVVRISLEPVAPFKSNH
ncbi:MAG TPA: hypothetical protein PKV27_13595, partial [Ilumatobacteraceae bacterium]|nr:hypothetical protein [Ilumatobacteraceae bacterium]